MVLLIAALYVIGSRPRLKHFHGHTMGTTYSVSYAATLFSDPVKDVQADVERALEDINDKMSTYRPDSELMQFNRAPVGKPFKASDELVDLVHRSLHFSRISDGAYDVTVGPLVNLWGFGPSDKDKKQPKKKLPADQDGQVDPVLWMLANYPTEVPGDDAINAALDRVGYQYLTVDTAQDILTREKDLFVDLSSIAKGYGVDKAGDALKHRGINNFMVEIGGEVLVNGRKPDGTAWRLGIRGPAMTAGGMPALVVTIGDRALATSGDYLNFFEIDGQKFSHMINPHTGRPEVSRLAEVAVIADTAADGDALATLFMVLGDKKGLALANREGIAAYFTYHSEDGGFKSQSSEAFKPYLQN
ncbi:hypothetical protein GZ77_01880 [Endozoicomonas montiporae]|uniref:FAD:protein FMN transferase n=3 Tax=Endozoicomonas montiporae TaxID=1027273 RepID=A0A081NAE8_9GAMM|nr:FAD:protein FMN transferase [Endozoicomonas montiporae]KEQ15421.1 hypothetical protein GZ77_01880 [Endozoicomonas montiporae]